MAKHTSSNGSDTKTAWKARNDAGPHTAVFPSGATLTFRIPDSGALLRSGRLPDQLRTTALLCAAHPQGAEGYLADLVTHAIVSRDGSAPYVEAIQSGVDLGHVLVAEMLVDPHVTADEVGAGEFPEMDVRMLLEFAERRRNTDAVGNKVPVIVLSEWATFRDGPPGEGGAGDGGTGDPAAGSDVPDADPVQV
jgi:hypothetical protein